MGIWPTLRGQGLGTEGRSKDLQLLPPITFHKSATDQLEWAVDVIWISVKLAIKLETAPTPGWARAMRMADASRRSRHKSTGFPTCPSWRKRELTLFPHHNLYHHRRRLWFGVICVLFCKVGPYSSNLHPSGPIAVVLL